METIRDVEHHGHADRREEQDRTRRRAAGDDRELGQFVTEVRRRLRDSEYEPRGNKTPSPTGSKATAGAHPQRKRRTSPRHRATASRVRLRTYNSYLSDEPALALSCLVLTQGPARLR